ncbi:MAG: class I SAM-dependent methyltransferase [Candidatus Omnitrophica bacterium]|nr:class I SAM-dependent methyltransferase [Candidatus Omnitrophota bacterium]
MTTLDLGCSDNKTNKAFGVDIDIHNHPDVVFDLNKFPYPIQDSSVDRVYAKHILEHLNDLYGIFKEIHRILKNDGDFIIEVPHFSCRVAYSEPEHNRFFSYFMFDKLIKAISCKVLVREITFHKSFRRTGIKFLANRYPDGYERFWTYLFPAENVKLHLKIIK